MDNSAIIKQLGLDDTEASIYLSLLRMGGSAASKVAKDVGIQRTAVYPVLKSMAERGFVTVYFRKNKRFYYAQRPHRVATQFEKKLSAFNGIVGTLESIERRQEQAVGLRYIETKKELEEYYLGILDEYAGKKRKEYYIIGSAPGWEGIDTEFFVEFRKKRGWAGIHTKLLLTPDSQEINPTDPALLRDYRYLPPKCKFKSTIDIHSNKVMVISPELNALAVVIEIPAMVDIFKSIFETVWELTPSEK